jgi:hypothetical protein
MANNPTIVHLDLSHNLISDAGCAHLAKVLDAKNCVLLFLNLCNNKIKKIGMIHLHGKPKAKVLIAKSVPAIICVSTLML